MSNELQIFENTELGQVRSFLDENRKPWFLATDVCEILGIRNSRDALSRLDEDEQASVGLTDSGQVRYFKTQEETRVSNANPERTKKYKRIVGEGLNYGKNLNHPKSPRETQPHWFIDRFEELLNKLRIQ